MKLILSTITDTYRTIRRKNTWLESCYPSQLTQINCHIFLHVLCKLTSTSMFLLEMMMPAQNLLCMTLGNIHEIKKNTKICSTVLIQWNVLYVIWKKSWSSFRYTEFFEFQKLPLTTNHCTKKPQKPGKYKKEVSSFWFQSLSIKIGRYSETLTVIYKIHPVKIRAILTY